MFEPPGRKAGGGCRERYLLYKFNGKKQARHVRQNGPSISSCWFLYGQMDRNMLGMVFDPTNASSTKETTEMQEKGPSIIPRSATKLKREDQKQQKQMRYSIVPVSLSKRLEMVCHMAES